MPCDSTAAAATHALYDVGVAVRKHHRADAEDASESAPAATTEDAVENDAETTPTSESETSGELGIKKGLAGAFIKPGEKEVSAEKFRAYQAEIAKKKAAAQKRQEGKVKKGPFGLW